MYYVNPNDVLRNFKKYIQEYNGKVTTTEILMEELQDAIDSAGITWVGGER